MHMSMASPGTNADFTSRKTSGDCPQEKWGQKKERRRPASCDTEIHLVHHSVSFYVGQVMQRSLSLALRRLDRLESDQLHRNEYSNRPKNTSSLQKQTAQQHAAQSIGIYRSWFHQVCRSDSAFNLGICQMIGFKKICATSR